MLEISLPKNREDISGCTSVIERMGFVLTSQLFKGLIHRLGHLKVLVGY